MKRASYRDAIDWIAQCDGAGDDDAQVPEYASSMVSACMVRDIFDVPQEKVGADIVKRRIAVFGKKK